MPNVTIAGGSSSSSPSFSSNDSAAFGNALATSISQAIGAGKIVAQFTVAATSGVAPEPASGFGGLVTFTAATDPNSYVFVNGADQAIVVTAPTTVAIQGGAAGGTVLAGSGGLRYTNITPSGNATAQIGIGGGDNLVQTASFGTGKYVINTGSGADTVGLFNGSGTVNAGTGNNLLVLGGGVNSGNSMVYSEGYDSIVGNITFTGGTDTVDIGSGQTTINPGSSSFVILDKSPNALLLLTGLGSDTVSLMGTGLATLNSGSGNTTLLLTGSGSAIANASSGQVTINAAGTTGSITVRAGVGNDSLIAGAGSDTLIGASGTAVMQSGTGATTFQFTNGTTGGADTITGFKAGDVLQLNGYGQPVSALSITPAGGNAMLTLSDGTQLTFAGMTSVNTSQIRSS